MKRIAFLGIIFIALSARCQQRPHYTQYLLNNYILNPALTGIENYTDLKVSARDQWVGLDGAPQTFYLTIHAPIGKKDYRTTATSYQVPGENPRGQAYWENYTAAEPHHGIGLQIINDKTGLYNRFSTQLTYAYHLGISPRTSLAAGFGAGFSKISRDGSKSTYSNNDPNDPAQASSDINKIRPDLSAGLWLYSADYFIGLSAQQIIPQKLVFTDDATYTQGRLIPHLFLSAGYRLLLSDDINMTPSVMLKYISPLNPQFDLNVKLQYQDLLWVGGGYRFKDGYSAMIGMNVGNTFNVSYSYDFTTTNLNTVSKGTHELMIGFLIGNKYGDTCPRNIW
jgi:type IX secretion system PorP/SprF family membrane protein